MPAFWASMRVDHVTVAITTRQRARLMRVAVTERLDTIATRLFARWEGWRAAVKRPSVYGRRQLSFGAEATHACELAQRTSDCAKPVPDPVAGLCAEPGGRGARHVRRRAPGRDGRGFEPRPHYQGTHRRHRRRRAIPHSRSPAGYLQ